MPAVRWRRESPPTDRYGFSFGRPLSVNRASFFLNFERRAIDEFAAVSALIVDRNLQNSDFIRSVPAPQRLSVGSARADWQINQNNQIVFRFGFNRNNIAGQGVGGINLPDRGFDDSPNENSFRLTETAMINPKTFNELRVD